MYPFLKFFLTVRGARRRSKLDLMDKSVLNFRVGLTDIDLFMELNHARFFTYMELGRWDYSARVGFLKLMKAEGWGVAVGGASVRYRRRVPFWRKFTLSTQLVCHDGRWFYFLQEIHSKNEISCSALIKACAVSKQGLVPATEVVEKYGADMPADMPAWVTAWIEAEGQRPWPDRN